MLVQSIHGSLSLFLSCSFLYRPPFAAFFLPFLYMLRVYVCARGRGEFLYRRSANI